MSFVWISEQTAIISLYNINWTVFITEAEIVYCAVRTGPLNQTYSFVPKVLIDAKFKTGKRGKKKKQSWLGDVHYGVEKEDNIFRI